MAKLQELIGAKTRMRIYCGESDRAGRKLFYEHVVERARALRLAGCTVFRGIEGFGAHCILHTAHLLSMSTDLPIVAEIVDERARLEVLLRELDPYMPACLVTLDDIEVYMYRAAPE